MVLHICITKVTFCVFVVRLAIFELDAVPGSDIQLALCGGWAWPLPSISFKGEGWLLCG